MSNRIKATHSGVLASFPGAPDVYVLEDKRRVISQRGCIRALTSGGKIDGAKAEQKAGNFDRYLDRIPEEYRHFSMEPSIEFELKEGGGVAQGREAEWFIDVCQAYVQAAFAGQLHPKQMHIAAAAGLILSSIAQVGLIAVIDEATNYQAARAKDDLDRILARMVASKKAVSCGMSKQDAKTALQAVDVSTEAMNYIKRIIHRYIAHPLHDWCKKAMPEHP